MRYYKLRDIDTLFREDMISEIADPKVLQCDSVDEWIEAAIEQGTITNIYELVMGHRGFHEIREVWNQS